MELGWEPLDLTREGLDIRDLLKQCSWLDNTVPAVTHMRGGSQVCSSFLLLTIIAIEPGAYRHSLVLSIALLCLQLVVKRRGGSAGGVRTLGAVPAEGLGPVRSPPQQRPQKVVAHTFNLPL